MGKKFLKLLAHPFNKKFLIILVLVNLLGTVYGFYWYKDQITSTPVKYLLFVPDSPFSSMLFTFMLLLILLKKRNSLLEMFACAGVIKYGIWAAVINFHLLVAGLGFGFENFMLTTSHLGMAIEGFVFFRHVKINKLLIGVTILWMLLNDYMDYGVGVHPYLFSEIQLGVAFWTALLLTIGITLYLFYLKYNSRNKITEKART